MDKKYEVVKLAIEKIDLKPGQTLVIRWPKIPVAEEVEHASRVIRESIPEGTKFMHIFGDIELSVISKEG